MIAFISLAKSSLHEVEKLLIEEAFLWNGSATGLVRKLSEERGIPESTLWFHLRKLRSVGIVEFNDRIEIKDLSVLLLVNRRRLVERVIQKFSSARPRNFEELTKICKEFQRVMEDIAFGGKTRGNRHVERVRKRAEILAEKLGADKRVVVIGALLHDIGLAVSFSDHDLVGARIAEEFLQRLGLGEEFTSKVAHCIEAHEGRVEPRTLEAKIVHDADALDKIGPLGIIRHTCKLALQGESPDTIAKIVCRDIRERFEKLQLEESKRIAKKFMVIINEFDKLLREDQN